MSALRVGSRRVTPVAREGRILHGGREYACRLSGGKLEYSTAVDLDALIAGVFLVGVAVGQKGRPPLPVGTILPLNPVSLKAMCIGVNERVLADDAT